MESPILDGGFAPYTTEQRNAFLSDMKQEILDLQHQVRDKLKKRDEIAHQVTEAQLRIEQLQARIDLATLCELSADSPKRSNLASPMPGPSDSSDLVRDIHPNFVGQASPACPSRDLIFSPSDQTLVEMGQIAAVEGAKLALTQDEDVMMLTVQDSAAPTHEIPRKLHGGDNSDTCDSDSRSSNRSLRPIADHGISNRKRRRLSGLFSAELPTDASSTPAITPHNIVSASRPIGDQDSSQGTCNSEMCRVRTRRAGILREQLSALPTGLEHVSMRKSGTSRVETERPVSFPQSQRWRKSLGVSVKTLTEGFEKMRLKQKDTKTSQLA